MANNSQYVDQNEIKQHIDNLENAAIEWLSR